MHCRCRCSRSSRSGLVLVVVLVAIMLLSLAGYTFAQLMFAEREAAWAHGRDLQTKALAQSGISWIQQQLVQNPANLQQQGGWYDNPTLFRSVLVLDGPLDRDRGRFTILSPRTQQGAFVGVRYGLEDESSRLNLNTLLLAEQKSSGSGRNILLMFPNMTPEIADAILDWMDTDDTPRQYGAERDFYSSQSPSYAPKNGPLESVEELLLVRGITPQLLFGMDADRNTMVDSRETSGQTMQNSAGASPSGNMSGGNMSGGNMQSGNMSGGASMNAADVSGVMNQGWAAYFTVFSMESNLRPDGQLKINLNGSDLNQLYQDLSSVLSADMASYIVAYRQGSVVAGNRATVPINGRKVDLTKPGNTKLASPLDLVGAKVQASFQGDQSPSVVDSPFAATASAMSSYIAQLLDNTTIVPAATVPGRININQASRLVLMTVPNLDAPTVDRIVNTRPTDPSQASATQQFPTWLYTENLVSLDTMKQIMPYITCSGRVYRAQVVGFFDRTGPVYRIETLVDATTPIPRLLFWRDLTHLGRGFSPAILGAQPQQ